MYMDGRGIKERTRKLNDALFDTVLPAIFGSSAAICGPFLSWAFLIDRFSWEPPATQWHWLAAGLISAVTIIGGAWASLPWFKAYHAVTEHRKNMERETAQRGRGWARS